MAKVTQEMIEELYVALLSLNNKEECKEFLKDLCTNKEIENMAQRVCAAKLLKQGATYNQVIEKTGISSATLARVSTCVQYGQGYNKILK